LLCAAETLRLERIRDPRQRPLLVVVTDGRATFGADALRRSQLAAGFLAAAGTASLVLDCEVGRFRMGLAARLADAMGAEYSAIGEIGVQALQSVVAAHRGRVT
jgi:magnesium chelatase subunit D